MEFDNSKLVGKIIEQYGKQYAFAKALGVSEHTLSYWLTGRTQMSRRAIFQMADLLGIADAEIGTYFFARKVQSH